jgi:hypothetical protein
MCQFTQIITKGRNWDANGVLQEIEFFARVSIPCTHVAVEIRTSQNVVIFQRELMVSPNEDIINGVRYRRIEALVPAQNIAARCNDQLTITLTCISGGDCTETITTEIDCKGYQGNTCPVPQDISIEVSYGGQPVDLSGNCIPSGAFSATVANPPAGAQIFWALEIGGMPMQTAGVNPTQFDLPAGNADALLSVTVLVAGCPPVTRLVNFPDRHAGPCPNTVSIEVRKNGAVVTPPYENLESGEYLVRVLAPVGPQVRYTYMVDNILVHAGPETEQRIMVQGMGVVTGLVVIADVNECCPPVATSLDLTSAEDQPGTPEPEPEDPNPDLPDDAGNGPGGPGNGGNRDNDDDRDWNWDFSLCGILYAAILLLMAAFIASWVIAFSTYPPLVPALVVAAGALVGIIALQTVMKFTCNMTLCRALRMLAWMFIWCAILCLLGAIVTLLALQALLLGSLIAGLVALALALWLHARGCRQPDLLSRP